MEQDFITKEELNSIVKYLTKRINSKVSGGPTFTTGSMPFAGPIGTLIEDNANLFWDNTNKQLGIGTASPDAPLHIKDSNTKGIKVEASAGKARLDLDALAAGGERWLIDALNDSSFQISQRLGGSYPVRFCIDSSGNVGIGVTPSAAIRLYALAPDAQSAIYVGIEGYTFSDATGNYGVAGLAVGGGGTNNIGVYGYALNAVNNYPFRDQHGNFTNAAGWQDVSDPAKKVYIRNLKLDEYVSMYSKLDDMIIKGYRMRDDLQYYNSLKEIPETYGLMANDPKLPGFIVSRDKKGIASGRVAVFLLACVKEQKRLIENLESKVKKLEKVNNN